MKKPNSSKILKALVYVSAGITISMAVFIISYILIMGVPPLIEEVIKMFSGKESLFSLEYNSQNVSLLPAVFNTLLLTIISITVSSVLGIFTAIYLVEYSNERSAFVKIIRLMSETLSGIPSIIYGLFGMIFFVTFLELGMSIVSGVLTISIMILPLIMRSTEEALKSVPVSFREASFGLGAGKLRTIFKIVLPAALNGILSGVILAIGRIVGETAALLYTAGTAPNYGFNMFETGRTLSVHMYMLSSEGLHISEAYATGALLLFIVLGINLLSMYIAKKVVKGN